MRYEEFIPGPALRGLVKCYWLFDHHYPSPSLERVIPDGDLDFVIHAGQRPTLLLDGREIPKPSVFTGGHLLTGGRLRVAGHVKMFGVKLFPWAAPLIYPMPAKELNNQRLSLDDVLGREVRAHFDPLVNEVAGGNHPFVVGALECLLGARMRRPGAAERLLALAMQELLRTSGRWTIAQASRRFGVSERYIERVFQTRRGMSFKYFCRLARVGAAIRRHRQSQPRSLAALAYEAGYADQSHQVKDFREIVGCPPSEFFREQHLYVDQLKETGA